MLAVVTIISASLAITIKEPRKSMFMFLVMIFGIVGFLVAEIDYRVTIIIATIFGLAAWALHFRNAIEDTEFEEDNSSDRLSIQAIVYFLLISFVICGALSWKYSVWSPHSEGKSILIPAFIDTFLQYLPVTIILIFAAGSLILFVLASNKLAGNKELAETNHSKDMS